MSSRQTAIQIGVQISVLSILTLITVALFTHVATALVFRRLVIGKPSKGTDTDSDGNFFEEHFVPVRTSLGNPALMDDETPRSGAMRVINAVLSAIQSTGGIPAVVRRGLLEVSDEIYVRCFNFREPIDRPAEHMLLCNPSGKNVDTLSNKVVKLAKELGVDSLVMFDYRPTGRSCKGIVTPDSTTMLDDSESVMNWLTNVRGVDPQQITVAGISLGGLQAMRVAKHHKDIRRLLLINTFSSFACVIGGASTLLFPSALRLGGTTAFLPDFSDELRAITTDLVAVSSVEHDERIPTKCTDEMLDILRANPAIRKIVHVITNGTHSEPKLIDGTLDTLRDFFDFQAV